MTMTTNVLDPSTGIADSCVVVDDDARPDPEVPERARRRTFTAKYKLEVLTAYDAAPGGEKGAVLRREGLYSSHIVEWRRARDGGALAGLTQPRGRPKRDRQQERISDLEQEKRRLEQELAKARFVVDVQAKLHALLETISEGADTEPRPKP
jgi:transposase